MPAPVHQAYVDAAPEPGRAALVWLLDRAPALVDGLEPVMSYGMPAFRRQKRIVLYVGAFKGHLGVYPPATGPEELVARLQPWRGPKGNLKIPYGTELPEADLEALILALAEQYASRG